LIDHSVDRRLSWDEIKFGPHDYYYEDDDNENSSWWQSDVEYVMTPGGLERLDKDRDNDNDNEESHKRIQEDNQRKEDRKYRYKKDSTENKQEKKDSVKAVKTGYREDEQKDGNNESGNQNLQVSLPFHSYPLSANARNWELVEQQRIKRVSMDRLKLKQRGPERKQGPFVDSKTCRLNVFSGWRSVPTPTATVISF
jgi:hypothetical protein